MVTSSGNSIPQLNSKQKPGTAKLSIDSPDFYISGKNIYAPMHKGNKVRFFTSGDEYFTAVAKAFNEAQHNIFIAGWQINFDIFLKGTPLEAQNNINNRNKHQQELDQLIAEQNDYIKDLQSLGAVGKPNPQIQQKIEQKIATLKRYDKAITAQTKDHTLWYYLRSAVKRGVKVYIMPWSCPPVGPLTTYDIEMMCATYQLNAGLDELRAFFTFSAGKSDMAQPTGDSKLGDFVQGLGGLFFSHHQKSVIIDNKTAYIGGIDLAYGRRDDNNFRLECSNRLGNDRYNPCIPHIKSTYRSEYMTRNTLLFVTLFEMGAIDSAYQGFWGFVDVFKSIANWNESPYSWKIAYAFRQLKKYIVDETEDIQKYIIETVFDPLLGYVATQAIDLTLIMIHLLTIEMVDYLNQLPSHIGVENTQKIKHLIQKAANGQQPDITDYQETIPAIREWLIKTKEGQFFSSLMGAESSITSKLPTSEDLELLIARLLMTMQTKAASRKKPYTLLDSDPKPLQPRTEKALDPVVQPRMPWHDMQIEIKGPSVYDVSRNFIDRWNAGQVFIDKASQAPQQHIDDAIDKVISAVLKFIEMLMVKTDEINHIGVRIIAKIAGMLAKRQVNQFGDLLKSSKPVANYINQYLPLPPRMHSTQGNASIQIVRSASKNLLAYEQQGREASGVYLSNYMESKDVPPELYQAKQTVEKALDYLPLSDRTPDTDPNEPTAKEQLTNLAMLVAEHHVPKKIGDPNIVQKDCSDAWIKVIEGSQHYLYIESQYFQSDFGKVAGFKGCDHDDYQATKYLHQNLPSAKEITDQIIDALNKNLPLTEAGEKIHNLNDVLNNPAEPKTQGQLQATRDLKIQEIHQTLGTILHNHNNGTEITKFLQLNEKTKEVVNSLPPLKQTEVTQAQLSTLDQTAAELKKIVYELLKQEEVNKHFPAAELPSLVKYPAKQNTDAEIKILDQQIAQLKQTVQEINKQHQQQTKNKATQMKTGHISGPMSTLVYFDDDVLPYLQYVGALDALDKNDITLISLKKMLEVVYALAGKVQDPTTQQTQANVRLLLKFKAQMSKVWTARYTGQLTKIMFDGINNDQRPQQNGIMNAIAQRIARAIATNDTFHTYLVMPVHPEGALNDTSIMNGVQLAMQTLYNGEKSLIKQIQIAMAIREIRSLGIEQFKQKYRDPKTVDPNIKPATTPNPAYQRISLSEATEVAITPSGEGIDPPFVAQPWQQYLTLLNLRTWETLGSWRGKRNVTEQIYVHSKLIIADDKVAVVGSCNVNDRAMLGNRDSEIAAIIRGAENKTVQLDGKTNFVISDLIQGFRIKIWRKLFALDINHTFISSATELSGNVLTQPAATETVNKIQKISIDNTFIYQKAFPFIPQNISPVQATKGKAQPDRGKLPKTIQGITYYPLGCSIWPLWVYNDPDDHSKGGKLDDQMPFDEEFWTNQHTQYQAPEGIQGFITELPFEWTKGEGNVAPMAQLIYAYNRAPIDDKQITAHHEPLDDNQQA